MRARLLLGLKAFGLRQDALSAHVQDVGVEPGRTVQPKVSQRLFVLRLLLEGVFQFYLTAFIGVVLRDVQHHLLTLRVQFWISLTFHMFFPFSFHSTFFSEGAF